MEQLAFSGASLIAIVSSLMAISRANAVHALLYLVLSILSISVLFYLLGAPFAAALEVVVYAGAVMVLFVFVIMMLGMGKRSIEEESGLLSPGTWVGPSILAGLLLIELLLIVFVEIGSGEFEMLYSVGPKQVGYALFSRYLIAVELASMLLLAALVSAVHIAGGGRRA